MNLKTEIIQKFIDEYKLQQSTCKKFGKTVSRKQRDGSLFDNTLVDK